MGLAEFILTASLVEITPGPNMAYLASLAAIHGRRAGCAAVLGILAGLTMYGLLAALGLAALIGASPVLYATLRFAGVAYLLWLAIDAWRAGDVLSVDGTVRIVGREAAWRGFVVNILNPKAGVFFVAVLPQFVEPERGDPLRQSLALVAIYVLVATAAHGFIVAAAGALRPWLARRADQRRTLQRGFALMLAGVAVWLLVATSR